MKILILGLNYAPEKIGIAVYTSGMAEYLAAKGHVVQIVAGQPYYPGWRITDGHSAWKYQRTIQNGVDVTWVPHYIPSNPSGAKRLLHHASFALSAFFPMFSKALFGRPDVVLTVAPSLIAAPIARVAALLCGAKSWLHIQDFEIDMAFATGLIKSNNAKARTLRWIESKIIGAFDKVSTISSHMCKKLVQKGIQSDRVIEFRNWANTELINPLVGTSIYREEWNIKTEFVALYSGNIANKQDIGLVIEAARQLAPRDDLTFIICGEGPNRDNLQMQANGLSNVRFYDLQPVEKMNELLGLASVHLLPQLADAADLVLPSKLANMLASGRPIIATAELGSGVAEEVEGCGLVTEPGNATALAEAIEQLLGDEPLRKKLGTQARERAENRWAKSAILELVEGQLTAFCSEKSKQDSRNDG